MRILANENISGTLVAMLREGGHDVAWVKEDASGARDPENLRRAQVEKRIVLTFDRGFGWLAYRAALPAECGVILLRVRGPSARAVASRVLVAVASRGDWAGQFAVVENDRIRVRPLPPRERSKRT